jgi:hypothetical protein
MSEARSRADWARTAALLALTANCHRDPKKTRALKPGDFDPFAQRGRADQRSAIDVLKDVFIDRTNPRRRQCHEVGRPPSPASPA